MGLPVGKCLLRGGLLSRNFTVLGGGLRAGKGGSGGFVNERGN